MFAMSLMLTGQGCLPAMRPVIPEIHGLLIDKQSRAPVPNAQILLSVEGESEVKTTSNDSGNFDIKSRSRLTFVPLIFPWDFIPPHGDLVITADVYKELSFHGAFPFYSEDRIVYELVPSTIMDDSPDNQLPQSSS